MDHLGLTTEEAARRLAEGGQNILPSKKSNTILSLIWGVIKEPILLLLIFAGLINFLLSEVADAIFLMLTVFIITGISIFQVRKSERAVLALQELTAPTAIVVRDGIEHRIPSSELVRGDLIRVREGDRVLADAKLVTASHLAIDESMLTGESFPVNKSVDNAIFSGTLVVKGYGQAIVTETGVRSQLGEIGSTLAEMEVSRTNLQHEIDRLVRFIAVLAIFAAATVFLMYGVFRDNWLEASLASIAAAMALVPEEFPIVLTVFMALGAWRLSKVNVITRHSPVIELLGTITVLCVDKTGTITTNQMTLVDTADEVAYFGLLACHPHPVDPMEKAFGKASSILKELELMREYPITEELLAVTQVWDNKQDGYLIAAKGSPEAVARLAGFQPEQISSLMIEVETAAKAGYRLLGVAKADFPKNKNLPDDVFEFNFEFIGIAKLKDPIREDVDKSVSLMKQAGVRTIMLTGDYPGTAAAIATEIGLDNSAGIITGDELEKYSDETLADRIKSVNVFARVRPVQKLKIIQALRSNGEIVAMTGDGVNDAPALSKADVGIAMGQRGTDVAREAAAMVLTDDDFNSIVGGIKQGRLIYANMRNAMSYVVAVHVPIFGLALLPVFTSYWPLVLLPAQIALLEIIIDPAASIAFESEKADQNLMKNDPRPKRDRIFNRRTTLLSLSQGLLLFLSSILVYFGSLYLDATDEFTRSITFATLMIGNILLVLSNRNQSVSVFNLKSHLVNPTIRVLLIGSVIVLSLIYTVPQLQDAFNLTSLSLTHWLVAFSMATLGVAVNEFKKLRSNIT